MAPLEALRSDLLMPNTKAPVSIGPNTKAPVSIGSLDNPLDNRLTMAPVEYEKVPKPINKIRKIMGHVTHALCQTRRRGNVFPRLKTKAAGQGCPVGVVTISGRTSALFCSEIRQAEANGIMLRLSSVACRLANSRRLSMQFRFSRQRVHPDSCAMVMDSQV